MNLALPTGARLGTLLKTHRAMAGSLFALAIKAGGALLMALIFVLAARSVSPHAFGELAVSFNALSFLAVFAVLGQDTLIVRSWGEYAGSAQFGLAHGAYRAGWRTILAAATAFSGLTLCLGLFGPFRYTALQVLAASAFLGCQIVLLYSSQACRTIVNFAVSETNRELTWRLVLLAVVAASLGRGLTPELFYGAAACGLALAVGLQLLALHSRFPAEVAAARPGARTRDWAVRARSMWLSASIEAAAQYAEVLLLGLLVSPSVAGAYFVAARVANVFAMVGAGLHTYTVSHAANLFFSGQTPALQSIFRSVMTMAVLLTLPMLVAVLVLGPSILNLFGPHYAAAYPTLMVLAAAAFTAAMAGPSSGMLLTTGHERLYSRVLLCGLLVRTGLILWLAPRYGALGAAIAWAVTVAPMTVGLSIACRRLSGIDPSVMSVLRRDPALDPVHAGGP